MKYRLQYYRVLDVGIGRYEDIEAGLFRCQNQLAVLADQSIMGRRMTFEGISGLLDIAKRETHHSQPWHRA